MRWLWIGLLIYSSYGSDSWLIPHVPNSKDWYHPRGELPYWDEDRFETECKKYRMFDGHWIRTQKGYLKFVIDREWWVKDCYPIPTL